MHVDHRRSAGNVSLHWNVCRSIIFKAYHDTLTECTPRIDISYTWVYMHPYRSPILNEDLLQEHTRNLASLDIGVRYKVPVWSFRTSPTETEPFFFSGTRLDKNIPLSWNLSLDAPAERLEIKVGEIHY